MFFKLLGKYEMRKNSRMVKFLPKNMCQSTWSDRSIVIGTTCEKKYGKKKQKSSLRRK